MKKSLNKADLKKLSHTKQVLFAIFCAKQVFPLVEEKYKPVCRAAIDTAIAFTESRATKEECRVAANAADAAAAAAAYAAAYAAADADADAAAYAYAYAADAAAAADAEREYQTAIFREIFGL